MKGMFEGQIKSIDDMETGESSVLRQFRWTDLMARLAATRDLRSVTLDSGSSAATSFADLHRETENNDDRPVNQDVLSRGKFARLDAANAAARAAHGDRENT
ncbi:hypothetical protein [Qipengyuania spongiae]|uniref:Uncharacterized protein n=1 Tax=Qipengyuania spongiae TaxID=2909673 RepID=A0ABY5T536_9SPHN|nr:hypothetical protein [Qipengyuania spongiae]UVI40054.1 hypothetical protein L1F33_03600 [Qipengyuania spongiae]